RVDEVVVLVFYSEVDPAVRRVEFDQVRIARQSRAADDTLERQVDAHQEIWLVVCHHVNGLVDGIVVHSVGGGAGQDVLIRRRIGHRDAQVIYEDRREAVGYHQFLPINHYQRNIRDRV